MMNVIFAIDSYKIEGKIIGNSSRWFFLSNSPYLLEICPEGTISNLTLIDETNDFAKKLQRVIETLQVFAESE